MNKRNIILVLLAISVVCGLVWALYSLANSRSWGSFVFMCAMMVFAVMATARYVDHRP